jgi:hypothetical protein
LKISQNSFQANNAKISISKLNLKVQNVYVQNPFKTMRISTTNHILQLLIKMQIYENCFANSSPKCCHFFWLLHLYKKSICASKHGPVGKKLANQVTLISILF